MRIGFLLPSIYASQELFPDKIYAPRELAIDLINGLVARGHDVTVFSVPDLPVKARIVAQPLDTIKTPRQYEKFRGLAPARRQFIEQEFTKHRFELATTIAAFESAHKGAFDVLHVYIDSALFYAHYLDELTHELPVVYTLHDPMPPKDSFEYSEFVRFAGQHYVSISNAFRVPDPALSWVDTVYHGIDLAQYSFNPAPGSDFLFLGRLVPEKGLHTAIAACKSAGVNLTASINVPREGEADSYYEHDIKPILAGTNVKMLDVVDKPSRIALYGQAKAFLFPIQWEEPFGVVLIEAMACGTPVVAFRRGSVPEIVKDGVTGFIVDPASGVDGFVEAMKKIDQIDRAACRKHIEEQFSVETMVTGYEKVYEKILHKDA